MVTFLYLFLGFFLPGNALFLSSLCPRGRFSSDQREEAHPWCLFPFPLGAAYLFDRSDLAKKVSRFFTPLARRPLIVQGVSRSALKQGLLAANSERSPLTLESLLVAQRKS